MHLNRILLAIVFHFAYSIGVLAQENRERLSPIAIASAHYKDSYLKITYGQPAKKNRTVFGGLVPYGQVWRTGANEATEITLTQEITIQGVLVPAGTYSLFTIPSPTSWVVILNKEVGLWGAYNYNSKNDLARWVVPVKKLTENSFERFTIQLEAKNNLADLNFYWDDICVTLPIQFNEPKK